METRPLDIADIDVEEVFRKFKDGIAREISLEDAESHLNLGIAYLEMGLVKDAVREVGTAVLGVAPHDTGVMRKAIEMLLTRPLLRLRGLAALRARLITN